MAAAAWESRGRIFLFNSLIYTVMIKLIQDGKPVNIPEEQDIPSKKSDPTLDNLNTNMSPLEMLEQIVKNRQNMNFSDKDRDDAYFNNYIQLLIRDEDFKRSSPQEQVSRLMAAGMSRSAALAALQGQEYGNAQTGIAGNVESNATERMNAVNNIVQNAAQLTQQIFELGCQIAIAPSAIKQVRETARISQMSAINMDLQLQASQDAGVILQGMANWHNQTGQDYAKSLDDMVSIMRSADPDLLPDVVASSRRYDSALSNPYFYPAMKSAYRNIYMDKNDLYNSMLRDNASAKLADVNLDAALADASNAWTNYAVNLATQDAQISTIVSGAKIASSQSSMAEDSANLSRLDANFWKQFDGKRRFTYLYNMTEQQAYDTALSALKVEYQQTFNEQTALDLTQSLKLAEKLGDDYFQQVADNMMQNEEYRNCVLQLSMIQSKSALNYRKSTDESDKRAPFLTDQYFRQQIRPILDYFKAYGVLDKAITYSASAAGFVATKF